jgi:tetratricopeptide (TPR) repeat protein
MKPRRLSADPLPRSPLDFVHPLVIRAPEVEGGVILTEVRPEHALMVLRALRLVLAWCRGPELAAPILRPAPLDEWEAGLHQATLPEGLWAPLVTIAAELRRPGRADAKPLAQACFALSEWALGEEARGTALLFAEAAALAWPANARHAWIVGRMLRNAGRLREGELWLRRAARVAVWSMDWETQDLALHSLGNLHLQQGSFSEARRYLGKALSLAQRHRQKEREGAVSHDLFQVFVETGDHSRAEQMAARAFGLYDRGHPNLPKLAHDVVYLWLKQRRFQLALPVLRALLPFLPLPHERLRLVASITRAAGATGDPDLFQAGRLEVREISQNPSPEVRALLSGALIDVAYGAASLEDWEYAAECLTMALEIAHQRAAYDDAAEAEIALSRVRQYELAERSRRTVPGLAAELAEALLESLENASQGSPAGSGGPT